MITITDPAQAYKNYIIHHIENGLDVDDTNSGCAHLLTEEERRNIVWHVLSLYMPGIVAADTEDIPEPVYDVYETNPAITYKKCSCGKK